MEVSLKYAVVERERRYLIAALPDGVVETRRIVDRYINGTRLRLREVTHADGTVVRKLTQKVRMTVGPTEIACTNFYLDDAEWHLLLTLPARTLVKTRHLLARDGLQFAVDQFADGTLVAECDDGDRAPTEPPEWLAVLADLTDDEQWTGASLAAGSVAGE